MASHGFDPGNPNKWYQSPHLGLIPVGYGGGIAGNCYNHSPVRASYHPMTNFTHPNSYPPPHHFTQPNPYPPPQHFTQPHSYPPPQHNHSATLINGHLLPLQFPCASQTQAQYYSSPHLQPTHPIAPQPLTTTPQIPSIPSYYTPHPNPNLHIHSPISPNSSHEPLVVHSHLWRARCKQVALESTAATGGVKKHRRFRLGTAARRDAGKCQKRKELLMRKPQFQLLLAEITQGFKPDLRLHSQPKTIGKPQGKGKFDSPQQSSTPKSISARASSSLISANDGSQVDMSVKFGSLPPSSVHLTAATTNGDAKLIGRLQDDRELKETTSVTAKQDEMTSEYGRDDEVDPPDKEHTDGFDGSENDVNQPVFNENLNMLQSTHFSRGTAVSSYIHDLKASRQLDVCSHKSSLIPKDLDSKEAIKIVNEHIKDCTRPPDDFQVDDLCATYRIFFEFPITFSECKMEKELPVNFHEYRMKLRCLAAAQDKLKEAGVSDMIGENLQLLWLLLFSNVMTTLPLFIKGVMALGMSTELKCALLSRWSKSVFVNECLIVPSEIIVTRLVCHLGEELHITISYTHVGHYTMCWRHTEVILVEKSHLWASCQVAFDYGLTIILQNVNEEFHVYSTLYGLPLLNYDILHGVVWSKYWPLDYILKQDLMVIEHGPIHSVFKVSCQSTTMQPKINEYMVQYVGENISTWGYSTHKNETKIILHVVRVNGIMDGLLLLPFLYSSAIDASQRRFVPLASTVSVSLGDDASSRATIMTLLATTSCFVCQPDLVFRAAIVGGFEADISKHGQAGEHTLFAFTLGDKQIICCSNKISWDAVLCCYFQNEINMEVKHIFNSIQEVVVCWNYMIAGLSLNYEHEVIPVQLSYATIMSCCAKLAYSSQGKHVHAQLQLTKYGCVNEVLVEFHDQMSSHYKSKIMKYLREHQNSSNELLISVCVIQLSLVESAYQTKLVMALSTGPSDELYKMGIVSNHIATNMQSVCSGDYMIVLVQVFWLMPEKLFKFEHMENAFTSLELLFTEKKLMKVSCMQLFDNILNQGVRYKDMVTFGATTQGHMLHDEVLDFSTHSIDSLDVLFHDCGDNSLAALHCFYATIMGMLNTNAAAFDNTTASLLIIVVDYALVTSLHAFLILGALLMSLTHVMDTLAAWFALFDIEIYRYINDRPSKCTAKNTGMKHLISQYNASCWTTGQILKETSRLEVKPIL